MDDDEVAREATKAKILKLSEWLGADRIESFHSDRGMHPVRSFDAWEAEKKIFSVSLDGEKSYARYQFDLDHFPLTIIGEILLALPPWIDGWKIAHGLHLQIAGLSHRLRTE